MMKFRTREEWLNEAVNQLRPLFRTHGADLPKVQVSVGWPYKKTTKTIGQCWASGTSAANVNHIYISPVMADPVEVLAVLVHELVHAVDNCQNGHKAPFRRLALKVGLEGPMKSTSPGEDLQARLKAICGGLGEYPHSAITVTEVKASGKGSRLIKVECPTDGYIARTTRKWLDELGAPICPGCNTPMEVN